jgi:hypothetical protein
MGRITIVVHVVGRRRNAVTIAKELTERDVHGRCRGPRGRRANAAAHSGYRTRASSASWMRRPRLYIEY